MKPLIATCLALTLAWSLPARAATPDPDASPAPPPTAAPKAAPAAPPPLVAAPPKPARPPLDPIVDVLLAGGTGWLAWRGLGLLAPPVAADGAPSPFSGVLAGALIVAALAVPPGAVTTLRSQPFEPDRFFAATAGSLVGLGLGWGASRWLGGDQLPLALAVGQGLGVGTAYHFYGVYRDTTPDLNRLPEVRKDDPLNNWQYWRGKRPQ